MSVKKGDKKGSTKKTKNNSSVFCIKKEDQKIRHDAYRCLKTAVVVHNPDTSIAFANKEAERVLGLTRAQLLGKKAIDKRWKFLREDQSDMPLEEYPVQKVINTKKELTDYIAGVFIPEKKIVRWATVNATPVFDDEGRICEVVINFVDVTKLRKVEEKIKESNLRYQSLVEASSDLVWEFDENEKFIFCSDAYKKVLGYSPEELIGKSAYSIMPKGESKKVKQEFQKIKKLRKPFYDLINKNVTKKGKIIILNSNGVPVFDNKGKYKGYRGVDKDITKKIDTENKIKESEAFLNQVIEQSPGSTWISDEKGTILRQNQACRDLFGIKNDKDVIGKYNIFKDNILKEKGMLPEIKKVFTQGKVFEGVIDYPFGLVKHIEVPGAKRVFIEFTIFPVKNSSGKVTNAVVQHKDITQEKKSEKELEDKINELEKLNEMMVGRELKMVELKKKIKENN